jgi:hypothetical protein
VGFEVAPAKRRVRGSAVPMFLSHPTHTKYRFLPNHRRLQMLLNFRGEQGSSWRNNGRKMADAPSRSGEVQGSFKRSNGRSMVLGLSDCWCSTNACHARPTVWKFVVDVLGFGPCQMRRRQMHEAMCTRCACVRNPNRWAGSLRFQMLNDVV